MSTNTFFDNVTEDNYDVNRPDKPIWTINKEDHKALLQWLKGEKDYLVEANRIRFETIKKNLLIYKGIQYTSQETRQDTRERWDDRSRALQKVVVNAVYDVVESRIAKRVKYRPAVSIMPTTDELEDKFGAKECEALIEHIQYREKFADDIINRWVMYTDVMGEAYLFILWDENKGDLHPAYKSLYKDKVEKGEKVQLLGSNGQPELDSTGKPIYVEKEIYIGDVSYELESTLNVLLEKTDDYEKSKYLFRKKLEHVEELRAKYPASAHLIKANNNAEYYDFESGQNKQGKNMSVVYKFYHKRCEFLPKGLEICFTDDAILHVADFPFKHKRLPCVRLTDIDRPGELHGDSIINHIKPLAGLRNTLLNVAVRNNILVGHPKWMMPAGAAKLESLGNDITIVQYKGPVAPQLVTANPSPPELYKLYEDLKMEILQAGQLTGVSHGEPPPGIKAGVALQFLNEQENERFNRPVLKFGAAIEDVAEMTLDVCASKYEPNDERMVQVLGKNNAWYQRVFNIRNLSRKYDIRVQNSTALPREKPARMQTLLELNERFPDKISGDMVLDLMDLAQDKKFMNVTTKSVNVSEWENEQLLKPDTSDEEVEKMDPQEYEDHLTHWRVHAIQARDWNFKYKSGPIEQDRFGSHVMAHEMLMWEKAKLDQGYAAKLAALEGWPMFYKPDLPQPAIPPSAEELSALQSSPEQLGDAPIDTGAIVGQLPPQ